MIPKFSAPMTKLIRTGEGIVLFGFNIVNAVLAAVGDVSPAVAIKYAGIFNAVAFASRQALKAVAAAKPLVGGDPIAPVIAGKSEAEILAEIEAVAGAAENFQSQPGTPTAAVKAGLAPDVPQGTDPICAAGSGFAFGDPTADTPPANTQPPAAPAIDVPAQ